MRTAVSKGAAVFVCADSQKPPLLGFWQPYVVQNCACAVPVAPVFSLRKIGRPEMLKRLAKLMNDSKGATAIEYGLIAALISIACIGAMRSVGTKLNGTFTNVETNL
jgi:pilus assembly protein Flp/PilA